MLCFGSICETGFTQNVHSYKMYRGLTGHKQTNFISNLYVNQYIT